MRHLLCAALITGCAHPSSPSRDSAPDSHVAWVGRVQRADYEGDRAALARLSTEVEPGGADAHTAARIRYWRGFALWRRAINGFNETPTPTDLAADLSVAEQEFDSAIASDPSFADAKIAAASCLTLRAFSTGVFAHPEQIGEVLRPVSALLQDARKLAPDSPRLAWVVGQNQWNVPPPEKGQALALETYQRGLTAARLEKGRRPADPLEPSWGEPELLMNLAWSSLNKAEPDPRAAEDYARQALVQVPYWHYVRDILLPQIHAKNPTP